MTDAAFGPFQNNDYSLYVSHFFRVVLAKFVCCVALHFTIYPHLWRSLKVMKYLINHSDKFTNFIIPFLCSLMNV